MSPTRSPSIRRTDADGAGVRRSSSGLPRMRFAAPACTPRSPDDLDRPALRLSGGQQQRLCIARALAAGPEVLLLDEPCSALDPISTATIEELIVGLRESVAVVIVTHNLQQARRVADHVAFMHLGELVEYGSASRSSSGRPTAARETTSAGYSGESRSDRELEALGPGARTARARHPRPRRPDGV